LNTGIDRDDETEGGKLFQTHDAAATGNVLSSIIERFVAECRVTPFVLVGVAVENLRWPRR